MTPVPTRRADHHGASRPPAARAARQPTQLTAWHSIGILLPAKCARRPRIHHIDTARSRLEIHANVQ